VSGLDNAITRKDRVTSRQRIIAITRALHAEAPARALVGAGRRASTTISDTVRATRENRNARPIGVAYRRLLSERIALEALVGNPSANSIAVIVCLWNRPERLPDILQIANEQRSDRPIRLVLWNNDITLGEQYRAVIAAFARTEPRITVELFSSTTNVGGIGRFLALRELTRTGYNGPFIMIDDDQNVTPEFVQDLLAAWQPRTIAGVWAWNNDGRYWSRTQVVDDGAPAVHVGTGGSICDSQITRHDEFFTAIPPRFLFMEDMWMSQYARRNGWSLRMVDSPVTFVLSEKDQGHALFDRKEEFYAWMARPGNVPITS
jgi:hypothetical protein